MDYDTLYKKVTNKVSLERIKNKVDKELADEIRNLNLQGVVVDEDTKRLYPFSNLAAQVIGFVGSDNQGIIGLEAKYDSYLKGKNGKILTETDAKGKEVEDRVVLRIEPEAGNDLVTTLDVTVQQYAEQTLAKVLELKSAKRGAIIVLNPQNGELYAMANKPDFNLNAPFTINNDQLNASWSTLSDEQKNNELNQMWRNFSINDSYEPGSTFKIVTSAAGLEEGVVTPNSTFVCTGAHTVAGRSIKCWRYPRAHGTETFVQGVQNSCNPVFMMVAERLGADKYYKYMDKLGLMQKTGIDLPGETSGIMHKQDKIGPMELATMSFGQSFQITPLQLLKAASTVVNGGYSITPHIGMKILDKEGNLVKELPNEKGNQVISSQTSETMKGILESVVSVGTGNKTYIAGYRVGGKTATSEKLPRKSGKYIASFLAFAPAENPQVMALVLIDEPQGVYYGGTVAGPVMKELLENTLPYLGIEPVYTQEELKNKVKPDIEVPDFKGKTITEVKKTLNTLGLKIDIEGEGEEIINQFPFAGEYVNSGSKIIIYTK
jgi:stage V sporulation protein D (sporulation-specific penicillin-binding protein)